MSVNRNFGLDLVRCIAILSVLLCHTMVFLYPFTSGITEVLFNFTSWSAGFYGVEIFFVLSGFLIGNIFIKNVVFQDSSKKLSSIIVDFWMRRWIRTLPNYFLFVLINLLIIPIAPDTVIKTQSFLKYLIFSQFITSNSSSFFGVSWSLAVEEWFYILMPLFFSLFLIFSKNRSRTFVGTMFLLLLIPTILKINFIIGKPAHIDAESVFHYHTFYKLDSIFYGLLLAWFWNKTTIHGWIIQRKKGLFVLGILGLLFSFAFAFLFVVKPLQNSILMILFAPLTSLSILFVFPFLYEWRVRSNYLTRSVTFVSLISYSLYLVHVPIIYVYKYLAKTFMLPSDLMTTLSVFLALNLISILLASFLYKYFEVPTLAYREKLGKLLAKRS